MKLNINKRQLFYSGAMLVVGLLLGWLIFGGNGGAEQTSTKTEDHSGHQAEIWTCSMHPQIQQDKPGQCPICGMDLIPLNNSMDSESALPDEVPMSASAMKLAEIQTMVVAKQDPEKEIRLLGKIKPDERLKQSQTVHIPGRIEQLYVNFTGEKVAKGQKIASIYSPQLVTAQKEFFEVLKDEETNPAFVNAARTKLKQWKLSDQQIAELERTKEIKTEFDVLSDHNGYVMQLNVAQGDYVKEGQQLFHLVDLSTVWVLFEAYENDLPWIKLGEQISIEVQSVPGRKFKGNISFIDPFVNPKTRVAYVRVELSNSNALLKPDMFADGILTSKLNMSKAELLVPKSAVLWTGKRAVVYVKLQEREHNSFIYREIILGEDAGDFYVVKTGLKEGEEIAVNGVFKIDAAAQLAGKKSMMNPTGGKVATGHNHGGMDMGGKKEDKPAGQKSTSGVSEAKLKVYGNCDMCKKRIEEAAQNVSGVQHAVWNKETKILTAHFNADKSSKAAISKAVAGVGHDTELHKATKTSYDDLAGCCQYDRPNKD
ncbi:MAG: efflux RND transporter periplasmic adaptor subunit [Flavobacteriales bacterium]|nr:efflux RND transporter periplasmic adaptor subunit [Flavobacteriales bacterium]